MTTKHGSTVILYVAHTLNYSSYFNLGLFKNEAFLPTGIVYHQTTQPYCMDSPYFFCLQTCITIFIPKFLECVQFICMCMGRND